MCGLSRRTSVWFCSMSCWMLFISSSRMWFSEARNTARWKAWSLVANASMLPASLSISCR